MLGLQVRAPGHLVFKFIIVLLQDFHGLGVSHMGKFRFHHMAQAL